MVYNGVYNTGVRLTKGVEMKKISVNFIADQAKAKWIKTIDVKRSEPYHLKTYQYVSEWTNLPVLDLPNWWLDNQTKHYEEPFENE